MNERLRIGDAEREEAAHELGEHYALGRISTDEHTERLEQIWAAKTSGDLAPAFVDLPRQASSTGSGSAAGSGRPGVGPGAGRAEAGRGWSGWPRGPLPRVPFLVKFLITLVAVVLVFTHLPYVVVGLLVYLFVIRRFARRPPGRRRPAHWY